VILPPPRSSSRDFAIQSPAKQPAIATTGAAPNHAPIHPLSRYAATAVAAPQISAERSSMSASLPPTTPAATHTAIQSMAPSRFATDEA